MPQLKYFVVCATSAIDAGSGRLSLIEVLDELQPQQLPTTLTRASMTAVWYLADDELGQDHQMSIRVNTPLDKDSREFRLNFRSDSSECRLVQRLAAVPIPDSGNLRFVLSLNGNQHGEFTVKIREPDPDVYADAGLLVYTDQQLSPTRPTVIA